MPCLDLQPVDLEAGAGLGEDAFLPVEMLDHVLTSALDRMSPGARLIVHEQQRITTSQPPDTSVPLVSAGGVSVAHLWMR